MSFTAITITDNQATPSGEMPRGRIIFTLHTPMVNGSETIDSQPVPTIYNAQGQLVSEDRQTAITLYATDDTGTTPISNWYLVSEEIEGNDPFEWVLKVSHLAPGGSIALSSQRPVSP